MKYPSSLIYLVQRPKTGPQTAQLGRPQQALPTLHRCQHARQTRPTARRSSAPRASKIAACLLEHRAPSRLGCPSRLGRRSHAEQLAARFTRRRAWLYAFLPMAQRTTTRACVAPARCTSLQVAAQKEWSATSAISSTSRTSSYPSWSELRSAANSLVLIPAEAYHQ